MQQLFITAITEDVVFYSVSQQHIEQFQQLAMNEQFPCLSSATSLSSINPFITTCNIWFSLHMHLKQPHTAFYLDEGRRFAYGAAFFQLEYIERHRAIHAFLQQHTTPQAMLILSYTLAIHTMNWLLHIMEQATHLDIVTYYLDDENFKNNIHTQTEAHHQAMQKAYMQTIVRNIREEDGLSVAISHAIRDAHTFLHSTQMS